MGTPRRAAELTSARPHRAPAARSRPRAMRAAGRHDALRRPRLGERDLDADLVGKRRRRSRSRTVSRIRRWPDNRRTWAAAPRGTPALGFPRPTPRITPRSTTEMVGISGSGRPRGRPTRADCRARIGAASYHSPPSGAGHRGELAPQPDERVVRAMGATIRRRPGTGPQPAGRASRSVGPTIATQRPPRSPSVRTGRRRDQHSSPGRGAKTACASGHSVSSASDSRWRAAVRPRPAAPSTRRGASGGSAPRAGSWPRRASGPKLTRPSAARRTVSAVSYSQRRAIGEGPVGRGWSSRRQWRIRVGLSVERDPVRILAGQLARAARTAPARGRSRPGRATRWRRPPRAWARCRSTRSPGSRSRTRRRPSSAAVASAARNSRIERARSRGRSGRISCRRRAPAPRDHLAVPGAGARLATRACRA